MKTQFRSTFGATHNIIYEEGVNYATHNIIYEEGVNYAKNVRKERPRVESLFSVFNLFPFYFCY